MAIFIGLFLMQQSHFRVFFWGGWKLFFWGVGGVGGGDKTYFSFVIVQGERRHYGKRVKRMRTWLTQLTMQISGDGTLQVNFHLIKFHLRLF